MKNYKCIKTVQAVKIVRITGFIDGGAEIFYGSTLIDRLEVTKEYMDKHNPQVGGYYVKYADGYESWSPAKVFEEGYIEMEEEVAQV